MPNDNFQEATAAAATTQHKELILEVGDPRRGSGEIEENSEDRGVP